MQDETGDKRWATKVEQHRALRKPVIHRYARPLDTFDEVIQYNGALIEDWMRIFQESWDRNPPINISRAAESEKASIAKIIQVEQELIVSELAVRGGDPKRWTSQVTDEVREGKARLAASCEVMKYKAFSVIDNQRAERAGELWRQARSLFEIGLAVFGAFLLFNQTRIAERQTEISERTLLASEEPSIAIENVTTKGDGIVFSVRNSGTVRLQNVRINERLFAEGILDGTKIPLKPFHMGSDAHNIKSLQPNEKVSFSTERVSLKELPIPRAAKDGKIGIFELTLSFQHEVTNKISEKVFQYTCMPSANGWHFSLRSDAGMDGFKQTVSLIMSGKE